MSTHKFIKCVCCQNQVQMEVIAEARNREYYGDGEYTDYHWKIYRCPYCSRASIVQYYAHSEHQDFYFDYEKGETRIDWPGFEKVLHPLGASAPKPVEGMPEVVKVTFVEAGNILDVSPKGAAALLRLALQQLLIHLGEKGENINHDIGELVKKGISPTVQQALDSLRVIGNNAVHPGQIDFNDNINTAKELFDLLNFIVEITITKKRQIETIYNRLPSSYRNGIQDRDSKKAK